MNDIQENQIEALNLKYSLFLGCIIPNRYPMIERATRNVFQKLGIGIIDMDGASCCPAPGVFRSVDKAVWLSLGARNINIAEKNGHDLLTLCNGCYGTLLEVDHTLKAEPEIKNRINKILAPIGRQYEGSTQVRQIMDMLYFDIGLDRIKELVKHKLGLRVAVHYGCHLLKPSVTRPFGGECENPRFFDEIVEALGCESIDYEAKQQCCGAGGAVRTSIKETSIQFTLEKMRNIRKADADCIVVCCPFCHLQFDLGQLEIMDLLYEDEAPFQIPVIFITQLMGLAMEMDADSLGLIKPKNLGNISPFISFENLLEKIQHIREDQDGGKH